jgi:hypothetical protein
MANQTAELGEADVLNVCGYPDGHTRSDRSGRRTRWLPTD